MNIEEINNYINFGSTGDICIYRELLLPEMPYFVESIYITGSYNIIVEFDIIDSVNSGDSWRWESSQMNANEVLQALETFTNKSINDWENISKTGKLSFANHPIDTNLMQQQKQLFKEKYHCGAILIPELPKDSFWIKSPFGLQKKLTGDISEYMENLKELFCKIHIKTTIDLASLRNKLSSIFNGKLNDGLIETNDLLIEVHKSNIAGQCYCIELYPSDSEHNNYETFTRSLKDIIDKLREYKIDYQIEL